MKKLLFVFFIIVVSAACKKEKKSGASDPEVIIAEDKGADILFKLDGTQLDCKECSYSYRSGLLRGITFNLPNSSNPMLLNFPFKPVPGAYELKKQDNNYKYVTFSFKKDGIYFSAVKGTMHVTESDTGSAGEITKMKATFSFRTDTVGNKYYGITDGSINFIDK